MTRTPNIIHLAICAIFHLAVCAICAIIIGWGLAQAITDHNWGLVLYYAAITGWAIDHARNRARIRQLRTTGTHAARTLRNTNTTLDVAERRIRNLEHQLFLQRRHINRLYNDRL